MRHPAFASTGLACLCNLARQPGPGSNFPSDLTPEHNNIIMSLPWGHPATLLLRVGDTGFDFSRFSWPLLHGPPEQGNYSRPYPNAGAQPSQTFWLMWTKTKALFPLFAPGITYTCMYLFFFFALKSPVSPLFCCCCCKRFSHVSTSIFLLQSWLFRFLSSLSR